MTPTQAAERLEQAGLLYRRARNDEALTLLAECEQWPTPYNERAIVLRAMILGLAEPIAALDSLPDTADAFTTQEGRAGYFLAAARAYRAARNLSASEEALDAAQRELRAETDAEFYLIEFQRAYLQWARRDYDPESPHLTVALRAADPQVRLLALNLRAWMRLGLEDHQGHLEGLLACLDLYEQHPDACSIWLVSITLQGAAVAAWERHDEQAGYRAREVFDALPWVPQIGDQRFACLRALAWHAFLCGEQADADRLFATAFSDAPSPAWKVLAHVDRAFAAHLAGDETTFAREICSAQALAEAVDWAATRDEERMALIAMAVLTAPKEPRSAERWIALYHRLHAHSLPERVEASHESRRVQAYQKYADGCIAAVLGSKAAAVPLLCDAYRLFSCFGLVFRAALAARTLYEITQEPHWLDTARSHASAFSKSAFAKRLHEDVQEEHSA